MSPFPSPRKSTAFSNKPGFIGAIARFWARTYAADYIALGLVATGFILVSGEAFVCIGAWDFRLTCRLDPTICDAVSSNVLRGQSGYSIPIREV